MRNFKRHLTKNFTLLFIFSFVFAHAQEQEEKRKGFNFSLYKGYAVAGYVDEEAFLNFTGPNINYSINESTFTLGMLPSLRFRKDRGETTNSFVTPNLGAGLTYSYKVWAIQIPFYYNAKTETQNGQWHVGIGLGLRLDRL